MAGLIQIGDIIKFSEIAWTVWNYGWASENNAGSNYRAFGGEVRTLHGSLKRLEDAVTRTQASLREHGARENDILGGDKRSLSEITGDYEATLQECLQLLDKNRRYNQTTGALRNIDWNINVMPQVENLRARVQMHNSRILHVLKPFEIDLINKIHGDLVRRLTGLHKDVLGIRKDINTIIEMYYPDVASAIQQQAEQDSRPIRIPDAVLGRLDGMFERCHGRKRGQTIPLQQLTDCFLVHLGNSTVRFQPALDGHNKTPPVSQYVELLKCQFVMHRIKGSGELSNPPRVSHWPGYVDCLEEKLSEQTSRFDAELTAPDISSCDDEMLLFRLGNEVPLQKPPQASGPQYRLLLEASLATEADTTTWKMMRLLRKTGSESQFRITETWGYIDELPTTEAKVVDFNLYTARLIPIYADPMSDEGTSPPLEIILEENSISHRYTFLDKADLLQFQEALTGFKVVDNYTESHAKAVFVKQGQGMVQERVTVQMWIPSHVHGRPEHEAEPRGRLASSASQLTYAPSSDADYKSRANSIVSVSSGAAGSSTSWSSLSQEENTRAVKVDSRPASTSHGTIRSCPRNPLLVLFTLDLADPKSPRRAIVCIKIDDETKPNAARCNCQQFRDCRIAAIEQRRGRFQTLRGQRLENAHKWDLLPLTRAPDWGGLLRVSILFPTAEARFRFSGGHCDCRRVTEGDVDVCVAKMHEGLLGAVRVYYRRQMIIWQEQRDRQVGVDKSGLTSSSVG